MKRTIFMLTGVMCLTGVLCATGTWAQTGKGVEPLIQNVYARDVQCLNGAWNYTVDQLEQGYYDYRRQPAPNGYFLEEKVDLKNTFKEYDFDLEPVMSIPGDWNTQKGELFFYEGTVWFKKAFDYRGKPGMKAFLYFGAVNYDAKVWLNGRKVGEHVGGFTPFNFDVTGLLREGQNSLVVKVDNKRTAEGVPTNNFDWFNYGGINRDVMLVYVPEDFIQTYKIQLKKGTTDVITVRVKQGKAVAGEEITFEMPELKVRQKARSNADGVAEFEVKAKPVLWSPENPKLYDVKISSAGDAVADQVGFRTISTRGRDVLLNGKPVFLRGISIHEEAPYRNGRIYSAEEGRILLNWARELGCNFVRLAHYPHNEYMVREAEKMGLMVWSEVPVYWTIKWEDPAVYANALNQLSEMIERDQNRANVVIWSIANETPHGDARDRFLASLAKYVRDNDDTRLVSMAMERHDKARDLYTVEDNLNQYVDIISFNQYLGWYEGRLDKLRRASWTVEYDKPIFISEFGAGAVFGKRGTPEDIWTEDYQAELYRQTLKMIDERMPKVAGISPWVLKDFRSPRRLLPQVQDGFNRKGVVSDKGQKKQAFFVLRDWYNAREAAAAKQPGKVKK